jgi:lipopolysaccharide/colanic/teichoic acid biosynthesis glycosyltransferase
MVGQRIGGVTGSLWRFQMMRFRTRRAKGSFFVGGRLLEQLELQRLPELLNVLRGEMGLIGVKPLTPEETEQLTEEWHQRRHEAPAGFTGLWYLQTDATSELDTVIVTDVYYTATRSWRSDIVLLLRTPGTWLRRCLTHGDRSYVLKADIGSM